MLASYAYSSKTRSQVLQGIRRHLDGLDLSGAERCSERLLNDRDLDRGVAGSTALVACGGGKDSIFALAFTRLVQLLIAERRGETFRLRSATNRHSGMARSVYDNIDRAYRALGLYDDPDVDLLLVDGQKVEPFRPDTPLSLETVARNRLSILLNGHCTQGNPRPTFCNACNLSLIDFIFSAATYAGGVDLIITGDSPQEMRSYYAWIQKIGRRLNLPKVENSRDIQELFRILNGIGRVYTDFLGLPRRETGRPQHRVKFFPLFADTRYRADDHWELLTKFLEFRFDELAFNFTETDCSNPALMAHIIGLRAERLLGGHYKDGIDKYVRFAIGLMKRKEFPQSLISDMERRYDSEDAILSMRAAVDEYARSTLGVTEENLICMVYSPFTCHGLKLQQFLGHEHVSLIQFTGQIHALLSGQSADVEPDLETFLITRLERISGLQCDDLRTLYRLEVDPSRAASPGSDTPIAIIFDGDPHKLRSPDGDGWISGR
jgi:hypothetical protein